MLKLKINTYDHSGDQEEEEKPGNRRYPHTKIER
jgi:hypothetical protein